MHGLLQAPRIAGTLVSHGRKDEGFLFFVRLIGRVYFKKHLAEFTVDTPHAVYMSLTQDGVGPVQQHIEVIRVCGVGLSLRMNCPHHLMPCGATGSKHAEFLTCGIRLSVIP